MTRESRLEPTEMLNLNSWRRALSDDLPCGMIHPRDAVALSYFPAPNATFRCKAREPGEKTKNRDFTVAALCGHITLLNDPHPLCVAGQVLATGTLCCVDNSTVCDIGWADDKVNGNAYDRWRKNRYSTLRRWMNEGSDVTTNMLGPSEIVAASPRLRLEFAIAFGMNVLEEARNLWISALEENGERSEEVDKKCSKARESALLAVGMPVPPTASCWTIATWL